MDDRVQTRCIANSQFLFKFKRKRKIDNRDTGKYLSEALILASTNPQYDDRLFVELRVQYIKIASLEHFENMLRTCCVHKLFSALPNE